MAVSCYSDNDLYLIAAMPEEKFVQLIFGQTVKSALIMRRNLQITLAAHAKKNPGDRKKLSVLQGKILMLCGVIERATRNAFTISAWRKAKKAKKDMTYSEKLEEKLRIKGEWENILKRMSY